MKTKILKSKEVRHLDLRNLGAVDKDNEMRVTGHAVVYDSPTVLYEYDGIEYKEVISRDAFKDCDISKCCLKYNHSDHIPILARVKGGSLKIESDNIGLKFEANLFDTSVARDVYALVKNGGLDKCSFAFTVAEQEYDKLTHTRTIKKIDKLFDVSIVDIPAYDDTDVSARDFFTAEAEKSKSEDSETLEKRKKLLLKIKLLNK